MSTTRNATSTESRPSGPARGRPRFFLPAAAALAAAVAGTPALAEPPPQRRAELERLLLHDCGSCHGLTLRGGLGPPLRGEALQGRSADYLTEVILHGRPGTPMPPWGGLLSRDDARWLARRLLEGAGDGR